MRSVFFTDPNTGYIAGSRCTILKTTNGGVSVDEVSINSKMEILLYPNPAKNIVNVDLKVESNYKKTAVLYLFNLKGQQLLYQKLEEEKNTIDVSSLTKGAYIVRVVSGHEVYANKLLIR